MDCRPSGCKERQLTTWETITKFNKSRNPLERVLFLETPLLLTLGSHSAPHSYSVSWHFLTLTSARSVSHHYSCKCHAQSKTVFSTNKEITTWYKLIYTQNKSHNCTLVHLYSYVCAYLPWYPSRSPQVQLTVLCSVNTHTHRPLQQMNDAQNFALHTHRRVRSKRETTP